MRPLSHLDVLVVDCQATAASPKGHLLELAWARAGGTSSDAQARLIALPDGERVPPAVSRITGITARMSRGGVRPHEAWRDLAAAAGTLPLQPAPTLIHYARFERPFLESLAASAKASAPRAETPLDILCTHEIARRLLPGLPRRSLRALAGYFGRAVGTLRRSADHVDATAFVWLQLVPLLEREGVTSWEALRTWLGTPAASSVGRRREWPMPRESRLALPDAPGIYRMLRTSGDVLYIGKASSIRHRVNSYFRKQRGIHERTLEMLSQARGVSFEVTPTALEAALREPDEIKTHRPPYNVALTVGDRGLWFAPPDLSERQSRASVRCSVGPFPSAGAIDQLCALARSHRSALGTSRWAPAEPVFAAGYARFCQAHPELSRRDLSRHARLLRLGTRLWHEGRRDHDGDADDELRVSAWTPELVQTSLEWIALRAALARRRARWLTRLAEAALVWCEPGAAAARLLVVERGDITVRAAISRCAAPPVPPGHRRPVAERHDAFTIARFDRLRVLTTELKRLAAEKAPTALRFGEGTPLSGDRLAYALSWV